jgi:hypothetical protein
MDVSWTDVWSTRHEGRVSCGQILAGRRRMVDPYGSKPMWRLTSTRVSSVDEWAGTSRAPRPPGYIDG